MKKSRIVALIVIISFFFTAFLSYNFWDISLACYFKGLSQSILNIAETVTIAGESKWYFVVFIPAYLILRFVLKNQGWSRKIFFLLVSISASGLINLLIKWLAGRHRPVDFFNKGLFGFDYFGGLVYETTSFPSGHAVTAFTLATAITVLFPRWRILAFAAATAIGMSRIMLTSNYLSDVLIGAACGIIYALTVKYIVDRYNIELVQK